MGLAADELVTEERSDHQQRSPAAITSSDHQQRSPAGAVVSIDGSFFQPPDEGATFGRR